MISSSNIQIEQPNEDELILRVKPLIVHCFMVFPIGLTLLFFLLSLYITSSVYLTCNRHQLDTPSVIDCKLVQHDFWGLRKQEQKIHATYYQSVIEEIYLGNTTKPDYEVILLADEERIKISDYSKGYNDVLWNKQNEQINNFMVSNNLSTITVGENNTSLIFTSIKLTIFSIIFGVIIWVVKINIDCILSKEKNTLSIKRYNWLSSKIREISLDEIEKIFLQTSDGIDETTSRIVFQLNSGENLPLTQWLDSYVGKKEAIKRINKFLKSINKSATNS